MSLQKPSSPHSTRYNDVVSHIHDYVSPYASSSIHNVGKREMDQIQLQAVRCSHCKEQGYCVGLGTKRPIHSVVKNHGTHRGQTRLCQFTCINHHSWQDDVRMWYNCHRCDMDSIANAVMTIIRTENIEYQHRLESRLTDYRLRIEAERKDTSLSPSSPASSSPSPPSLHSLHSTQRTDYNTFGIGKPAFSPGFQKITHQAGNLKTEIQSEQQLQQTQQTGGTVIDMIVGRLNSLQMEMKRLNNDIIRMESSFIEMCQSLYQGSE